MDRRARALAFALATLVAVLAAAGTARAATAVTVTVGASETTLAAGESVTLTATIVGATGGLVTFTNGGKDGTPLDHGVDVPVVDGVATLETSFPAGTYSIVAGWGASSIKTVWSQPLALSVGSAAKHATMTTLTTSTIVARQDATFTATVTQPDGTGTPTGLVTFFDSGVPMGPSVALVDGTAVLSVGGFAAGTTHVFSARYEGDALNLPSTSTPVSRTIAGLPSITTTIDLVATPNPAPVGTPITLRAHVYQPEGKATPPAGKEVSFWNTRTNLPVATAALGEDGWSAPVTLPGLGSGQSYSIQARYEGDATFPSPPPAEITVSFRPVTTVTAPSFAIRYGDAIPELVPGYGTGGTPVTPASCTTTATPRSLPGDYPVTCSGAADPGSVFAYVDGTLTVTKAPLTIDANDALMPVGGPLPALTGTLSGFVNGETLETSGVTGAPECTTTATETSPAGDYPITCTGGSLVSDRYAFVPGAAGRLTVTSAVTVTPLVTGPVSVSDGSLVLRGTIVSGGQAVAGVTLTLSIGGADCETGPTDADGVGSCVVTDPTLGPTVSTASFGGDDRYRAGEGSEDALLYAFAAEDGTFAIGDRSAATGATVTFWGARWSKVNRLGGGAAPSSFKGYVTVGSEPGRWTASPGNSQEPPHGPLPSYLGVVVTRSASSAGSTVTGTIDGVAIVRVDPGYDGNPGHPGTGTVVALVPATSP